MFIEGRFKLNSPAPCCSAEEDLHRNSDQVGFLQVGLRRRLIVFPVLYISSLCFDEFIDAQIGLFKTKTKPTFYAWKKEM